jgi:bacillaene synthase trans-acting acyltransferase
MDHLNRAHPGQDLPGRADVAPGAPARERYEINPLTVAYKELARDGLKDKLRGEGLVVRKGVCKALLRREHNKFLNEEWPVLRARLQRLGIDMQTLAETFEEKWRSQCDRGTRVWARSAARSKRRKADRVRNSRTVFMFSGQGSHYVQMGRELFDREPTYRKRMLHLDEIVKELSGESVVEALYLGGRGKAELFARTALTHPAIFMVELSLAELLIHRDVVPDVVLGCSLGSFAAATVAGMVDAEHALTAVIRQATMLEACCEQGGMIAVLADPAIYEEEFLNEHSDLAAVNFASHFVVSAVQAELPGIEANLKLRKLTFQRLPVSIAFHSRWMDPAREPFESFMRSIRTTAGHLPMMCCERAVLVSALPNNYFWGVVRNPIRFGQAISELELGGVYRYIDVGPAGTLATFLKYVLPASSASTSHLVLNPFAQEQKNLASLLGAGGALGSLRTG